MSFMTSEKYESETETETEMLPLDWTRMNRTRECCRDKNGSCQHEIRERFNLQSGQTIEGHVLFCLHEMDPEWFQGYFTPKGTRRPWGLLAIQEELDDCLQCADGGYRRVTMTVYPPNSKPIKLQTIDWTGGDMIRLRHEQVDMQASRLWTGGSSLTFVDRYFKGLVGKLRKRYDVGADTPILKWLPDMAAVSGKMMLIPKSSSED